MIRWLRLEEYGGEFAAIGLGELSAKLGSFSVGVNHSAIQAAHSDSLIRRRWGRWVDDNANDGGSELICVWISSTRPNGTTASA